MMISRQLSEDIVAANSVAEVDDWLNSVEKEIGSALGWRYVGGRENNIHTIHASTSAGLALVERPTNSIDAVLEMERLRRREKEDSHTPQEAVGDWFGVLDGNLSKMDSREVGILSENISVRVMNSGEFERPTVQIQDTGTGQHPDDWDVTLLSLGESNKKRSKHLMGVYNSGGSASYRFSRYTVMVSRLNPDLLNGKVDEIGVSIVRYNKLEGDTYVKTGTYEYCRDPEGSIIRLDLVDGALGFNLPNQEDGIGHGTVIKHIAYNLDSYSGQATGPKKSLWHLFNTSLPMPLLPLRVYEERESHIPVSRRRKWERRTIKGNMFRLSSNKVSEYSDTRIVDMEQHGTLVVHYHVIDHDREVASYITAKQALSIMYNGQCQGTRDRTWLKRKTNLNFLHKRLVVHVDFSSLSNETQKEIFSSTREGAVDSKLVREMLDRAIAELNQDEGLKSLNESDRMRMLDRSIGTTSKKLRKRLAREISRRIPGLMGGSAGGTELPTKKRKRTGIPPRPEVDDSHLLETPNHMAIVNGPLNITQGSSKVLVVEINAKNDFVPVHGALEVILDNDLMSHVYVRSSGRLTGGRTRVHLQCDSDSPIITGEVSVSLVIPDMGVNLSAGTLLSIKAPNPKGPTKQRGGDPPVDVHWVSREERDWTTLNVGMCDIQNGIDGKPMRIDFYLNKDFGPWSELENSPSMTEDGLKRNRERYATPVCVALLHREWSETRLAEEREGQGLPSLDIPSKWKLDEEARMAYAVISVMSPEVKIGEPDYNAELEEDSSQTLLAVD